MLNNILFKSKHSKFLYYYSQLSMKWSIVRLRLQTRHILIESTKNTRYTSTGEIYEGKFLFALLPFLCMT